MNNKTVLLAMSGGVDSSVAALLLKKQGYNVIGAFMKNWSDTKNYATGECNWKEELRYASQIASLLDIPIVVLDFEKEYKKIVVKQMFKDYKKGITPNPDILCNEKIKFPLLWKVAKKYKADYIVTGHYARIKRSKNKYILLRGKDEMKDQSYFLYRLSQEDLSHSLFPIGDYTKLEIREIAKKNNFPNSEKKSTVGICFIGKINMKNFLQKKIKPKKGKILDPYGKIVGKHDGIYYYTIGQRLGPRHGIDISKESDDKKFLKRWYVAKKDVRKNIIIAAPENHNFLYRKEIIIQNPHFITNKPSSNRVYKIHVRIRQVGELLPATLSYSRTKKRYHIILNKSVTGISQGQAIVLYKKNSPEVIGGGEISF
jgi:tRNA-specific 2-thiouridylase